METRESKTLSIVVAGWHFKYPAIYRKLVEEASQYKNLRTDFYITSHRSVDDIDSDLIGILRELGWNILSFENKGWDWGAYQQFLLWQRGHGKVSDYYLFLHDDIRIKRKGFVGAFISEIKDEVKVVGNSLPHASPQERKWFETSPHIFFWAESKGVFLDRNEAWKCVRGSCFLTVKEIADNILLDMLVRHGLHCGFGNWSVKIFGGLVRERYGNDAVRYLSERVRKSRYIDEEYRSHSADTIIKRSVSKVKSTMPLSAKKVLKRMMTGQKSPSSPPGLKLNLGCGERYREGHLNIDAGGQIADINSDILDLNFDNDSVSEVLMVHVLEHIDFHEVGPFLARIFRWLRKDGLLIIEFPDVLKVARLLLRHKGDMEKLHTSPLGIRGLYGEPVPNMTVYDYHKWGWSAGSLKSLLQEAGFTKIYTEKPQHHGQRVKRDTRIVAIKQG